MPCKEGADPADFSPGAQDPTDNPSEPDTEASILDGIATGSAGSRKMQFVVELTYITDVDVTLRYDTSNGIAQAGTHFTGATNQHITISAGNSQGIIEIPILEVQNVNGNLNFGVTISSPVNATIDDATAIAWITYPAPSNPPPDPDPGTFTGWPKPGVVYDQFVGCDYTYACTAAAAGAAMSGLYNNAHNGNANKAFDWKKLYRDAGGCLSCSHSCDGESWTTMLRHMKNTGIKEQESSTFHKISSWSEITGTSVNQSINRVKDALRQHGVVYFVTPWYGSPNNGWNRCLSCNSFVIRNPDKNGPFGANSSQTNCDWWTNADLTLSPLGQHVFVITGWNDSKAGGAFEIQSSHGRDWGSDGRCWMPYSFLKQTNKWRYYKLVYGGTV